VEIKYLFWGCLVVPMCGNHRLQHFFLWTYCSYVLKTTHATHVNLTMTCVRLTIVTVERKEVLQMLSVCL